MQRAQASLLPDGRRLHLQHGPIDLIIEVFGAGRDEAYRRATTRFETILCELVTELPELRSPGRVGTEFSGSVASRMQVAIAPYCDQYVTPMAAVAGAVADEILHHICLGPGVQKAYVNNGGDVAFHLAPGEQMRAALASVPGGLATLQSQVHSAGLPRRAGGGAASHLA